MPSRSLLTTVLLCASVGCSNNTGSVTTVAEDDPRLKGTCTLYRLNGDRYPGEPIPEGSQHLHGWEILESCSVNDLSDRSELLGAFDKGIFISSKESIDCFNPRHASQAVTKTRAVISFAASQFRDPLDAIQQCLLASRTHHCNRCRAHAQRRGRMHDSARWRSRTPTFWHDPPGGC